METYLAFSGYIPREATVLSNPSAFGSDRTRGSTGTRSWGTRWCHTLSPSDSLGNHLRILTKTKTTTEEQAMFGTARIPRATHTVEELGRGERDEKERGQETEYRERKGTSARGGSNIGTAARLVLLLAMLEISHPLAMTGQMASWPHPRHLDQSTRTSTRTGRTTSKTTAPCLVHVQQWRRSDALGRCRGGGANDEGAEIDIDGVLDEMLRAEGYGDDYFTAEGGCLNPKSQSPNPNPQTPIPKPQSPNPKPQYPNPKPQYPNTKHLTLNTKTLNPKTGEGNA